MATEALGDHDDDEDDDDDGDGDGDGDEDGDGDGDCDGEDDDDGHDDDGGVLVAQECSEAPDKQPKEVVHCVDAMVLKLAAARLHHPSKEMLGVHDISNCMEGAPRFLIFYFVSVVYVFLFLV